MMQLFKSIKKIRLTTLSILLFISGVSFADSIGDIVESTGIGAIVRNNEQLTTDVGFNVSLYDTAQTANGRMLIEFLDKAELALTEHTKVYIDEVIYDPDPSKSKMSMRFALGTARFASGKLAMVNKANIDIRTPTATIGIRGTDFTTSVDEIGRSLIILLPDENGDSSGEIIITNDAGTITLTEAYQAISIASYNSIPESTVTLQGVTPSMIDKMFIVNPPEEIQTQIEESVQSDLDADGGILDVDFLEFNELEQDALADNGELEFTELDIDMLEVDFLRDLLEGLDELDRTLVSLDNESAESDKTGSFILKGAKVGLNPDSQYNIFERDGDLVFFRSVNGVINIQIAAGNSGFIDTTVDSYQGVINFGNGTGIEIVIRQR